MPLRQALDDFCDDLFRYHGWDNYSTLKPEIEEMYCDARKIEMEIDHIHNGSYSSLHSNVYYKTICRGEYRNYITLQYAGSLLNDVNGSEGDSHEFHWPSTFEHTVRYEFDPSAEHTYFSLVNGTVNVLDTARDTISPHDRLKICNASVASERLQIENFLKIFVFHIQRCVERGIPIPVTLIELAGKYRNGNDGVDNFSIIMCESKFDFMAIKLAIEGDNSPCIIGNFSIPKTTLDADDIYAAADELTIYEASDF